MPDRQQYLLGLDAGNTVIKAVLFDLHGRQVATSALDGQSETPEPGHVERSLPELWRNAVTVIRGCLDKAGIAAEQIAAIGCAGHGNGLYLLDKAGAPLLAVQSLDSRAADISAELAAGDNDRALHAICLQKPWPSQTPSLLAWVKRHQPEIYSQIGTVFLCKDFITFQLTGRRVSDLSDMSGCGLLRMPGLTYDDGLLARYGLADAKSMLPDLVRPDEVVGGISAQAAAETGLAVGTPVVGGLFDVVASALGSGAVENGQASIIAGTWSINQVLSESPVSDENVFMVAGFAADRFINIEASATSAANLEWYVRELVERDTHHDDPFGHCNALVASVTPAADDPFYHPYLYGSGQGADHRAGYYGVAGWHGESHLLRALFEGVAFEHKRHIDVLGQAGVRFDRAILSGGGSRSPIWPQMFADILGIPVTVAKAQETGALGAAIAAGIGAGLFADYHAAVGQMTASDRHYAPDTAMSEHYRERYLTFTDLATAMAPIWARLNAARGLISSE
ncbi:MAG: carbohydrate kinase [Rhodobacteraceae bacterium]|nr:carbohydrate kinase [Paracoccaceae bacterium]